jgi:hypothetical protein
MANSFERNPDGSPKYTNALAKATSPYLLQHAHNPVDWQEWGEASLAQARAEDKPILLSIGYSTCYWCHVMEREVFSNPEIATLMNAHFINIKIDREERPDLDEIYMVSRQLLTREGGWPNNVFLTPNLKPYFAGGTFSSDNKYGRMGFPELVTALHQAWEFKKDEVLDQAEDVATRIKALLEEQQLIKGEVSSDTLKNLGEFLYSAYDRKNGGFYQAPKFPNETALLFLQRLQEVHPSPDLKKTVSHSLDSMAAGGLYDHLGGGFHRYAVDEAWQVPHFEKMLYNQALLALAYTESYRQTENAWHQNVARSTIEFVLDRMQPPKGGFYSALDAETDETEGAYYTWTEQHIRSTLSAGAAEIFFSTFALADVPHFEGHKHPEGGVVYAQKPLDQAAREHGLPYEEFQGQLDKILGKLLLLRYDRESPTMDTKIIAGWNGLMLHALANAGNVFNESRYIRAAETTAHFILKNMLTPNNTLLRTWHNGTKGVNGFLEDYAFVIRGLLALYVATGKDTWLQRAIDLINKADDLFWDKKGKGFFYASPEKNMFVNMKTADDGAIPSANAVMLHNLAELASLTEGTAFESKVWEERAWEMLGTFKGRASQGMQSHVHFLHGYLELTQSHHPRTMDTHSYSDTNTAPETTQSRLSSAHYVKISANIVEHSIHPGGRFTLEISLLIADGWHINTNPAGHKHMIPTSVRLNSENIEVVNTRYPKANSFASNTGGMVDTYTDKAIITIDARLSKYASAGNIEDMTLHVSYQACNDSTCLEKTTESIEMPLVIASR